MLSIKTTDQALSILMETDRLEAANTNTFKSLLTELPSIHEKKVVIHMEHVRFIDSSGIGAILGLLMKLTPKENKLYILNPQPQVANVIRMLRLENVLKIEHSTEQ